MYTQQNRIAELINTVNTHAPNKYDYPVQDIMVEPINKANESYIKWVKEQTATGAGFKYSDDQDKPINQTNVETDDASN